MLRDERLVALNDVIVACKDAANGYDDAAGLAEDSTLAALFRDFGERRRQAATELDGHVRRLGDLPRGPDADAETVERLVTHMKAAFSTDERATLLQEREDAEAEIGRRIGVALDQDPPEETKTVLRRLSGEVSEAAQRLTAARASPG